MGCTPWCKVCRLVASMCKMVPVMVISGIVAWSYYAYVIHLCILTIRSDIEKILLLVFYHITITLFLLCYWRTIWTRPGGFILEEFAHQALDSLLRILLCLSH